MEQGLWGWHNLAVISFKASKCPSSDRQLLGCQTGRVMLDRSCSHCKLLLVHRAQAPVSVHAEITYCGFPMFLVKGIHSSFCVATNESKHQAHRMSAWGLAGSDKIPKKQFFLLENNSPNPHCKIALICACPVSVAEYDPKIFQFLWSVTSLAMLSCQWFFSWTVVQSCSVITEMWSLSVPASFYTLDAKDQTNPVSSRSSRILGRARAMRAQGV